MTTTPADPIASQVISKAKATEAMVAKARDTLMSGAETETAVKLTHALNELARSEGEHHYWDAARTAVSEGYDGLEALGLILDSAIERIATQGADDTWSGRGNDVRRSQFEGVRMFIYDARLTLKVAAR